jgi:hypothetical protein
MQLIGLAQGAGLALYVLLVELLAKPGDAQPNAELDLIRTTFLVVAVALFIFAGRLRKYLLAPERASVEEALVPGARLRRMTLANVAALALCEGEAVFGLIVVLAGGPRQDFYLFAVLALVSMLIHFPRPTQWHAWYAARGQRR